MGHRTGFTLIETLFTTLIMLIGLTSLAVIFFYSTRMRDRVRQQTLAIPLVYSKMEELRATPELILPGRYSQELPVQSASGNPYLTTWEISDEMPRRITVTIWTKDIGRETYREVASVTTLSGSAP